MTQNVSNHVVPLMSVQSAAPMNNSPSFPVKDCFTKTELVDIFTRVLTRLQDKWSKVAETPPKSVAIYEDTNLVRMVLDELKVAR